MTFDSLVFRLACKLVDAKKPLCIHIEEKRSPFATSAVGEVKEVAYWPIEKILNIAYKDHSGTMQDFRWRPVTGKMFDDTFTIKKIDGVDTFTYRQKEEVTEAKSKQNTEEYSETAHLKVKLIQKALKAGIPVTVSFKSGLRSLKGPLYSVELTKHNLYVFTTDASDGWKQVMNLVPTELERAQVKTTEEGDGKKMTVTLDIGLLG